MVIRKLLLVLAGAGVLLVASSFFTIYTQVKRVCVLAMTAYDKNCNESLISVLGSTDYNFKSKNMAVWALGQLADKSALPTLLALEATLPDEKKCTSKTEICKYEVQKAIKWCQKGNITNWMYTKIKG